MRQEQLELLRRIKPLLNQVTVDDPLLTDVSHLMSEIGNNVNSNDYLLYDYIHCMKSVYH